MSQTQDGESMALESLPEDVREVAVAVIRARLAGYDAARAYAQLSADERSNRDIRRWTHDRGQPPRVDVLPLSDGFSGATPYEVCERYAVGEIDRDMPIDEFTNYLYVPGGTTDGYDPLQALPRYIAKILNETNYTSPLRGRYRALRTQITTVRRL